MTLLSLKSLPNMLTASRALFAAGFLLLLALTNYDTPPAAADVAKLDWAFILFVIAGLTDILDGPLARRLNVTSKFGRTFDPFVDKLLILGGFIALALIAPQLTGIAWWMAAIIAAREIWVTAVRHLSESQGTEFGATWAGKLKMFLQSFALGTTVMYVAHFQDRPWALTLRDLSLWTAVGFTAASALIYLPRMKHLRLKKNKPA